MTEHKGSYIECGKCGHSIPFTSGGGKVVGSGKITATCPKCGHEHSYAVSEIKYRT
jgi:hypothetical protein